MSKNGVETTRTVILAGLGLCEHCGELLTIEDLPAEAINAVWLCPKCNGILSGKTFGYDEKNKKVHWVGPDGKWLDKEPKVAPFNEFTLGTWRILINPPSASPY
jgi:hypothetical protein